MYLTQYNDCPYKVYMVDKWLFDGNFVSISKKNELNVDIGRFPSKKFGAASSWQFENAAR